MITIDLHGQRALVTGASGGIGAAIALRLAEAGAHVVVHYRSDADGAAAVLDGIGSVSSGELVQTDLGAPDAMTRLFGGEPFQIVVNNAGAFPVTPLLDMTPAQWRQVVADNLDTTVACTVAAAAAMTAGGVTGAIVNIASTSALQPAMAQSHYNSAKAAVLAFTRSAAVELAPYGIRVNALSPGLIERPTLAADWPDGVARWMARCPIGRLGQAGDVADACLYLVSPLASFVTGHNLVVDGGITATGAF